MNIFKKYPLEKQRREEILNKLKGVLEETLVNAEIDIRYLEREKLIARDSNLIMVENKLRETKGFKEGLQIKIEVVLDEIKGK